MGITPRAKMMVKLLIFSHLGEGIHFFPPHLTRLEAQRLHVESKPPHGGLNLLLSP